MQLKIETTLTEKSERRRI